jgi:hypothetical protein
MRERERERERERKGGKKRCENICKLKNTPLGEEVINSMFIKLKRDRKAVLSLMKVLIKIDLPVSWPLCILQVCVPCVNTLSSAW